VPILHALPAREEALGETTLGTAKLSASGVPRYDERRIDEGCCRAESPFSFQTQHGMYANTDRWDGRRLGWTKLGMPNYRGQYTHGDLGYGQCYRPYYKNDEFAID
jgi:hypothetical protein